MSNLSHAKTPLELQRQDADGSSHVRRKTVTTKGEIQVGEALQWVWSYPLYIEFRVKPLQYSFCTESNKRGNRWRKPPFIARHWE